MKNPLRDWRLVGALSLLAAASAGYNVVRPWLAHGQFVSVLETDTQVDVPDPAPAVATPVATDETATTVARIQVTAVEQLPHFSVASIQGRDPFGAAQAVAAAQLHAAIAREGASDAATDPGLPTVTAIVVTEHWRAAVIDGRFVAPGQRIGDRVVTRIDPDTVQMRGADREPVSLAYLGAAP